MRKIFISYSHDHDAHKDCVRRLASRLAADLDTSQFSVVLDQHEPAGGPDQGWPAWSESQASKADTILLVITESYLRCWESGQPPGMRNGATYEADVIRQRVYGAGSHVPFLRVVVFQESDRLHIPKRLAGLQTFHGENDYGALRRWVCTQPPSNSQPPHTAASAPPALWPDASCEFAWSLADRRQHVAHVRDMLSGRSVKRVLLVEAATNMGKSQLLREIRAYARHVGVPFALLDFKGSPSFDDIWFTLQSQLDAASLGPVRDGPAKGALYSFLLQLKALPRPLLLILDTYEKASTDVREWVEQHLLRCVQAAPACSAVLAGQQVPRKTEQDWEALAHRIELEPIDCAQDWLEYVARCWPERTISEEHIKLLIVAGGGVPGFLHLLLSNVAQARGGLTNQ